MADPQVAPDAQTSPIFRFGGQRSRWRYPDPRLPVESSQVLNNINLSERGTAQRRPGYTKFNDTILGTVEAVTGLAQANFQTHGQQIIEVTKTLIQTDNGTTRKDIVGSVSLSGGEDDRTRFVFVRDQLVATNGVDPPWVWDGDYGTPTAATTLSGVAFTWCKDFVLHKNILVALNTKEDATGVAISGITDAGGGAILVTTSAAHLLSVGDTVTISGTTSYNASYTVLTTPLATTYTVTHTDEGTETGTSTHNEAHPTRMRWSDIDAKTYVPDIETWPTDNRTEVYAGGAPIVGGVDNWHQLLVFKEDGVYPLQLEFDTGFIEAKPGEPRRGFHPIARHSLIARPEFVFGIAREGAFIVGPDLSFQIITLDIQDWWVNLNQARLQYAVSWVVEKEHQIHTLLSSSSNASGHDKLMVWDWETGEISIDTFTDVMSYGTDVYLSDVEYALLGGHASGYVYKGHTGVTDDTNTYGWEITTAPNDVGAPGRVKVIHDLHLLYRAVGSSEDIYCAFIRDEGGSKAKVKNLTLGTAQSWDAGFEWNTGKVWGDGILAVKRTNINRSCENFSLRLTGQGDANLIGYQITYSMVE